MAALGQKLKRQLRELVPVTIFFLVSFELLALTEVATVRIQEPFVLYRSYLWMCLPRGTADSSG